MITPEQNQDCDDVFTGGVAELSCCGLRILPRLELRRKTFAPGWRALVSGRAEGRVRWCVGGELVSGEVWAEHQYFERNLCGSIFNGDLSLV
jgi:hypothetical protein